jgi:hypothetical protein
VHGDGSDAAPSAGEVGGADTDDAA